jgi:hypothetical protein
MDDIPADLKAKLEARLLQQVAAEVRGDVSALYQFILPSIRARRIAGRDDEPELSLSSIREFVGMIHAAEILSIRIEEFQPSLPRHRGLPAAVVVSQIRYKSGDIPSEFRCIWVYADGSWYTTSLGKRRIGNHRASPPE